MARRTFDQIGHPQHERLAHIEFRLLFLGSLNRADLRQRFNISTSAAARDLACYRQQAPGNIVYDQVDGTYRPGADCTPLYNYTPTQVLTTLAEGFGDDFASTPAPWVPAELPSRLSAPSLDVLMPLGRALHAGRALRIAYNSLSSGFSMRTIVPLVLVDNGLRWHLRAFDVDRRRYADFVLNRIEAATVKDSTADAQALRAEDYDWQKRVDLELVPHPSLAHPRTIAVEYGMSDGLLRLRARAALAGYLLRRWNVDCTTDHSLDGPEYLLWLKNSDELYQIAGAEQLNLTIAPGFSREVQGRNMEATDAKAG